MSELFLSKAPKLDDYWRGIVLFGRNVASYKFALAKSLLELQPTAGSLVKLTDLAPIYAKHIAEHLRNSERQGTFSSSKFLNACRDLAVGSNELIDATVRYGFNKLIDAFHVVGTAEIPERFYIDERTENGLKVSKWQECFIGFLIILCICWF